MSGRTLFIHIGPAKTGTSAVQHVLGAADGATPLYPRAGRWWDGAHHNLVFNFYGDDRRPETSRENIGDLFARIGEETRGAADILISSEAFWGRDLNAFIQALLPHLDPVPGRVEILATCRAHLELASSLYNQLVKDVFFAERRLPDDFLRQEMTALAYGPTLETLRTGPYPLRLVNYHPAADFVPRFLRMIGFSGLVAAEARNASLGALGLAATLGVNQAAQTPQDHESLYRALEPLPGFFGSCRGIFSLGLATQAELLFARDRKFLADTFGIDLPASSVTDGMLRIGTADQARITAAMAPFGETGARVTQFTQAFAA